MQRSRRKIEISLRRHLSAKVTLKYCLNATLTFDYSWSCTKKKKKKAACLNISQLTKSSRADNTGQRQEEPAACQDLMNREILSVRDVGTQAPRAAIQPAFLSSQAEKRLSPRQVRVIFLLVAQKRRLDYDPRGLGSNVIAPVGGPVLGLTPTTPFSNMI